MDALEAIAKRRSIRAYSGETIPREDLIQIVNAGRLAASGMNTQPWDFIVVTERALIHQLKITHDWIECAGAVIAVVMDPGSKYWVEDGSAAVQNMLVAITALGYGACWIEGFTSRNEETLKGRLKIPAERRLLTLIPVGVAAEAPHKEKKPLEEVLHWEQF